MRLGAKTLLLGGLSVLAPAPLPPGPPRFEKMVECRGKGPDYFVVEVARGERGLFSCELPVAIRLTVGGADSFRTVALLTAKDADHDGTIRLDEWRVAARASPVVSDGVSVATIDFTPVDVRDDVYRVEWIDSDGQVMSDEIATRDLAMEEPTALIR
jgi:hypothetical protein